MPPTKDDIDTLISNRRLIVASLAGIQRLPQLRARRSFSLLREIAPRPSPFQFTPSKSARPARPFLRGLQARNPPPINRVFELSFPTVCTSLRAWLRTRWLRNNFLSMGFARSRCLRFICKYRERIGFSLSLTENNFLFNSRDYNLSYVLLQIGWLSQKITFWRLSIWIEFIPETFFLLFNSVNVCALN